jgi:Rad3-related DNA helicase
LNPQDLGLPSHFKDFRSEVNQLETILSLASSPKRASLVSAPPGSGKTLIAISVPMLNDWRTLYLTATKAQSNQINNDFSSIGLFDLKGHVNYPCARSGYTSEFSDFDFECSAQESGGVCDYRELVNQSLSHRIVSTNYAHWISILKSDDPGRLGHFDLIVLDEAHKAADILTDFISVNVNPRSIYHFLDSSCPSSGDSIYTWYLWAKEMISKIKRQISSKRFAEDRTLTKKDILHLTRIEKDLSRFVLHYASSEWVAESNQKSKIVTLSPVWPMSFTERYLFNNIAKIIAVSATINEQTGKYLGIPQDSMDYIEVDSSFPKERRPFIYVPTTLVDYKMSQSQKQLLISQFDRVIEGRLDRKGAIQCISYDKGAEIQSLSKFRDSDLFMTDTRYESTQDLLTQFIESDPPSLLNSPAIEEGINLADDSCRYQIIYKMPMIDGRGKIIQARMKEDKGYKLDVMRERLEQMYGRPTRSKSDWSETFIFDDYFFRLRNQVKWHKWFSESWVRYSGVPKPINF